MDTKTQNLKRGAYAAHIGYSMFGARGPLLAPEGDGNGAASAGSTVETTTAVAPAPTTGDPATAPGAASEKMLPQSQVNTLIAQAKRDAEARGREAYRKELEAQTAQPAAPKKEAAAAAPTPMTPADVQQVIARERALERAGAGLTPGRQQRMETACRAENPSDIAAWCKSYREDMGFDTTAAPAANSAIAVETKPPPATTTVPAAVTQGPTAFGLPDVWNYTPAQLDALGPKGLRAEFEKLTAIGLEQSGAPPRPRSAPKR